LACVRAGVAWAFVGGPPARFNIPAPARSGGRTAARTHPRSFLRPCRPRAAVVLCPSGPLVIP
jgi:hypothetical protein